MLWGPEASIPLVRKRIFRHQAASGPEHLPCRVSYFALSSSRAADAKIIVERINTQRNHVCQHSQRFNPANLDICLPCAEKKAHANWRVLLGLHVITESKSRKHPASVSGFVPDGFASKAWTINFRPCPFHSCADHGYSVKPPRNSTSSFRTFSMHAGVAVVFSSKLLTQHESDL